MKTILSIAASDPSAGAGIQQDLKTITSMGHYALTVITALTAQNTHGVTLLRPVSIRTFRAQIKALLSDIQVDAVKIGVIPNLLIAQEVRRIVSTLSVPVVLDPVLTSTSGFSFVDHVCVEYIKEHLLPLCTLATPNIPEAAFLLEMSRFPKLGGHILTRQYGTSFLVKGGHSRRPVAEDVLFTTDGAIHRFSSPRIASRNLHGTGCTLSSAIATLLALGKPLPESVALAKHVTEQGILRGRDLSIGSGNGPLWMFPL